MADMKISDTLALTRSLDEFRHLDQQERALAERMAAHAAEARLVETKKDVEEAERSVADRHGEGSGPEYHGSHKEREKKEEEAPPEVSEGHLLDLKA